MNFEWDEVKSNQCLEDRGFDFAYVANAFLDPERVIRADHRYEYGEERLQISAGADIPCGVYDAWRCHPHHFGPQG